MPTMKRIALFLMFLALAFGASAQQSKNKKPAAPDPDKTRVLIILDCSNSMWDRWQSDAKIKVTQKVLLKFLDSVANQQNIEVALRVFGHLNRESFGTRLEVPFEAGNNYRIQSKIKTLVPNGGCTITTALENSLNDFPMSGASRNIILIITDGIDDCDGNICQVARQVQMSGVIVQTFILGIGKDPFKSDLDCAGKFTPVQNEEQYTQTLYDIFTISEQEARVVLRVSDEEGRLYENETPIAFYDSQTQVAKYTTIYAVDDRYVADTLTLDPLVAYDVVFFTHPATTFKHQQFVAGAVNTFNVTLEQGQLRLRHEGRRTNIQIPQYPVIVHEHGKQEVLNVQQMGEQLTYRAGEYDLEVLCTPPLRLEGVSVQNASNTDLTIPMPGVANITKPKVISTGSIFQWEEGRLTWVCNLDPSHSVERLLLMPGDYQVVIKPKASTRYSSSQTQRFQVEAGMTTQVYINP